MTMPIRRIVIAIDASPGSVAALEAAVELAAALEAEVLGLFVEDINLLRWSSLPFARQVGASFAVSRPLTSGELERQLRLQAEQARATLAEMAQRLGIRSSFRITRGIVAEQLVRDLTVDDLLSLGIRGRLAGPARGLGSTARRVAVTARGRILLLPPGAKSVGPVAVIFDGTATAVEALETALSIARGRTQGVHVFCVAPTEQAARALVRTAIGQLGPAGDEANFRHLQPQDVSRAAQVAASIGANTLILPIESDLVSNEALESIASGFPGCVLIVRGEGSARRPTRVRASRQRTS